MRRPPSRTAALLCFILFAGTLALYWAVLHFSFVNFDDAIYVYENDVVQQGLTWHGLVWAFTGEHAANWHPLTWLSHMIDCQLFGLRAGLHHFHNVIWHALTGMLLFIVLNRVSRAMWRSAFVAALFLWHPMHVESVAWVSERKDVLSALFFVATLLSYSLYADAKSNSPTHSRNLYILTLALFTLGLLAKSMLVTTPLILLLLDYWPLRRAATVVELIKEKLPFFILAVLTSLATFFAQRTGGSIAPLERIGFAARTANALIAYGRYIQKLLWPADLSFFYIMPRHIPWGQAIVALALLTIISLIVLAARCKSPWLVTGWFWFVIMLLPVIGIIQVGRQAMADRYSYLPSIGLFIAIVWTICELAVRTRRSATIPLTICAMAILAVLVRDTARQISYWQNSGTLMQHAIDIDPDNFVAHQNLGMYWFRQNRPDLAVDELRRTNELHPDDPGALNALGFVYLSLRNQPEAEATFRQALRVNPNDAQALCTLGTLEVNKGNVAAGMPMVEKSVDLKPTHPEFRYELARALVANNRLGDAIVQYRQVLHYDPDYAPALRDLAWLLATCPQSDLRNGPEAVQLAEHNCHVAKNSPQSLNVLDAALAEAGRFPEAIATAEKERDLYLQHGDTNSAAMTSKRIDLYQHSQPFHTPAR